MLNLMLTHLLTQLRASVFCFLTTPKLLLKGAFLTSSHNRYEPAREVGVIISCLQKPRQEGQSNDARL